MKIKYSVMKDIAKYVDCLSHNQSNQITHKGNTIKFELSQVQVKNKYYFLTFYSLISIAVITINDKYMETITARNLIDLHEKVKLLMYETMLFIDILLDNKEQ